MPDIKVDDFVVATKQIEDIVERSVGYVETVLPTRFQVFFIGMKKSISVHKDDVKFLDITKTGKPYPVKICNICHILKNDPEEFDINQTDAKGRKTTRPSCKMCRVDIDGVHLIPAESRRLDRVKPTKLFTCPICKKSSIPFVTANFVKDHDHKTGNARAWICDSCNTGLGRFKDDIELIKVAIKYLESFEDTNQNQS